jgi:hypothetical protein
MIIVVFLLLIFGLVCSFWRASRASRKGYSYGLFLFLGLLFSPLPWLMTYALPTKLAGETMGQASGRAVTTGVLNVGEAARDAGRERSPGIARGIGAAGARATMNAGAGVRDAVAERRQAAAGVDNSEVNPPHAAPTRGMAANLAGRATRTALNAGGGVREAVAEHRIVAGGDVSVEVPTAAPTSGLAANLAKRATRTAMNAADAARKAAAEHRAASAAQQASTSFEVDESVEARLDRLETLRERGLLTADEHQQRRDAIIAEL